MTIVNNTPMGDAFVRDFDDGMYTSLESFEQFGHRFVPTNKISTLALRMNIKPPLNIKPPMWCENHNTTAEIGTRMPGFPIIWGNPDDSVQRYNIPCFRIKREDPSPALERRRSIHLKSRSPAPGAQPLTVTLRDGTTIEGYDSYEEQYGAWPYDIPYTLTCEAAGTAARAICTVMLKYMMMKFPPYAVLTIKDSLEEERKYNCFVEGPSNLSDVADIRDRVIIEALSIRVSAEYDLEDFRTVKVVKAVPSYNGAPKQGV
jgi:hypothetical protein